MKKNKTFADNLLLYGFLCLMVLPILLFAIFKNSLDTVNYENRDLTPFPSASNTSLQEFPAQFESYLGDNAPFRNQFMTLNASINMLFGVVDSSDVLKGEDNWLFLKDVSDSKSISDYQGLTYYSQQQQQEIFEQINELQSSLSDSGYKLAVVFAPAKEGVYSNYMPAYIPVVNEQTRVEGLSAAIMQNTDIPVIFPKETLKNAAQSTPVYYKYDTHWNEIGAYITAQEIYKSIGYSYNEGVPNYVQNLEEVAPKDLANVSATWNIFTDDIYYSVMHDKAQTANQSGDGYITHFSGNGKSNCIVITDSFGEALMPFLSAQFNQSVAIHGNALNYDNLQMVQNELSQNSSLENYIIIEVAERFSDTLLSKLEKLNEYY